MYCVKCGQQLPDDANFCLKCGAPQKKGVKPRSTREPRWETCEIAERKVREPLFFGSTVHQFVAEATSPEGRYIASTSEEFKARLEGATNTTGWEPIVGQRDARPAFDAFVTKLMQEGWESTTSSGRHWYSHRFRRRVED